VKITLPIRTVNALNAREHWAKRAKRARQERYRAGWYCAVFGSPSLPLTVTLTRVSPRKMDDDGSIASLKNIRDGVADHLGVDDGSDLIAWKYAQRKGKPKEYAVEIEIESR